MEKTPVPERCPSRAQDDIAQDLSERWPSVSVERAVPLGTLDVVLTAREECDEEGREGAELKAWLVSVGGACRELTPIEAAQRRGF